MSQRTELELLELLVATIDEQLAAQTQVLTQILAAVQTIAKPEDIQPLETAQATAQASLTAIQSALATVQTTTAAIAAKLPVDATAQPVS